MISKRKRPCASLPPPQHQLSTSSSLSFLPALTFLFLLCLTPLLTSAEWDGVAITQADYEGLQAIKHDLSDPTGALRTWNDTGLGGACSGSWEGIKCVKGQVVAISLPWHGLTGTISPKVGQLTALKRISLHDNFLHGPVPAELGLLPDLRGVYLFNNRLSGAVPPEIGTGCKLLQALDLSNNQLVGSIPESLAAAGSAGSTGKLFRLNLSYNFLSGPIPAGLALSGSLTFISLQHNNLSGDVPDTWGKGGGRNGSADGAAYQLQVLQLDHNALSGAVPASLGRLPQLQVLTLGGNQLNGTIPSDLGKLSGTIQTLDLSGNSIGGTFPAALCNLSSLSRLDLGGNQIDGDLPAAIGGLKNLTYLSLKGNKINGPIPAELGNATSLSWLDLSGNSFDGEIPESIANLTKLASFDVSNNNLTGPVPVVLAERFNSSSFRGNIQLCGYKAAPPCPLPSPPPSTSTSPASSPSSSTSLPLTFPSSGTGETSNTNGRRHRLSTREVILIVCGCVLAVMLLLCCVLLWCLVRNRVLSSRASAKQRSIAAGAAAGRDDKPGGIAAGGAMEESSGDTGGRLVHFEGALVFTADDLLCATAEIMGKSAYGTVYKATLEDGNQVTVKRLREKVAKGPREFETEVSVLGGIRHPNLLELRAYYLGPKGEKLLVFDYMPKGSLAAYLHARGPDTTIDWPTRMGIAMGITRGILYLHTHHGIVHGNMTSANILLDDTSTPKIADYGLSRLMTAAAAAGTGAVATAGALGYRAPELAKMKKPTAKTDVYSLGVVILELLTGKSPGESMNGVGLPQWVANIVKEEWTNEVFDLELMRNAEGNPSEVDELLNTLKLALHCVDPSPAARPEVQQVLKQLEEIKPELAETGGDVTAGAGGSGTGEGMPAQTTESD